jgi:hydrogenase maturation protease
VGVGNVLLSDEGLGVHVARRLLAEGCPGADVVEAGTSLLDALEDLGSRELLVVVDAMEGCRRGEAVSFELSPRASKRSEMMSLHDGGVAEALMLAEMRGLSFGRIVVVGASPLRLGWGEGLSEELERAVGPIIDAVRGLVAAPEVVPA